MVCGVAHGANSDKITAIRIVAGREIIISLPSCPKLEVEFP
jgi:hypothetical protein